ncbi:Transcriptional coactivator hfi1 [Escovopsis weberi]|uniref:Transcriptional coactivator hfi1 n=1 Tax=Escovopsis weberi TaxID=150374 RepID=A0A0M8N5K3_ESCWE|nr:Transcriptional coactivator hfi1 [Escovopsis weberi]
MPDIDPAALSRPSVNLSTPILATKTLAVAAPGSTKAPKTSQIIPARIDLEPLYTALKAAISPEQWLVYKESTTEFLTGRLNQTEYSLRLDPILASPNGEKEHLHNQLFTAIYGNVTREMPDQGLAPWVSANDKPAATVGSKPVSGDAAERRLKGEVMQLPARDRRRIKDLAYNDYDPHENLANVLSETHRKQSVAPDVPASAAGGINKMNFDLEIRKRFTQPLAVESGEFPDMGLITGRMLPFCYEAGLANGHVPDASHLMSIATETFIKEVLTQIFSRTRSNGPGDSGNAGFGVGTAWVQTHKYRRQLHLEEDAAQRGEVTRDKGGLLPIESKAASERGPLGMADLRIALEMADSGMSQFPAVTAQILYGYREGELENWDDYTWIGDARPASNGIGNAHAKNNVNNVNVHANANANANVNKINASNASANGAGDARHALVNGTHPDAMDIDSDVWWEGFETQDMDFLDGVLDSCLAVGS